MQITFFIQYNEEKNVDSVETYNKTFTTLRHTNNKKPQKYDTIKIEMSFIELYSFVN